MSQFAKSESRRVILIDDDPTFGHIMKKYAAKVPIDLDFYESLADLGFIGLLGNYDVAILDYDLGDMTGTEIGEYLTTFFRAMPMLLISGTVRQPSAETIEGGQVRPFMHKKRGPQQILATALSLLDTPATVRLQPTREMPLNHD